MSCIPISMEAAQFCRHLMSKDTKAPSRASRKTDTVTVTKSASTSAGRVVWHVTHKDGKRQVLTTSRISNAAIKDAAVIYGEALKRLAKR